MEYKYYTPELSDICFGYECEVYNSLNRYMFSAEDGWIKTTIGAIPYLQHIPNLEILIAEQAIRIPFLNSMDLERRGWKYIGVDEGFHMFELQHGLVLETDNYHNIIIDNGESRGDRYVFFDGTINNATEFDKLIKQLGV